MTCSHGTTQAFCWDDATPKQRQAYDAIHRHAYDWAIRYVGYVGHDGGRDQAETYAGYAAGLLFDDPEDVSSHTRLWEEFLRQR